MSLTDTKSSLKKILSIIEELNGLNTDSIPKLQTQPNNLLEQIGKLEETKANGYILKPFNFSHFEVIFNILKSKKN